MIKTLLKIGIAAAIIFWLFQNGQIDFSLILKSFQNPVNWAVALGLLMAQILVASCRWKILLSQKALPSELPYSKILSLTWVGLFFSTVLPGVVTGDVVKLFYAKELSPRLSKSYLLTSVLLDRIFGLIGLICIMGVATLSSYDKLIALSTEVETLVHFNFFLLLGVILFLATLLLPSKVRGKLLGLAPRVPLIGGTLFKVASAYWAIGSNKLAVIKCISLSIFAQSLGIFGFWNLASPFFEVPLSLVELFTFLPVGLISVAIPLTPSGLGVGHAVFGKLFSFYGVHNGASLFNLQFLCLLIINLQGAWPYILLGKKKGISTKEVLETEL